MRLGKQEDSCFYIFDKDEMYLCYKMQSDNKMLLEYFKNKKLEN